MRPQKLISNSRHLEGSNSVGHFEIGCLSQEKTGSEIWVYYGEYSLTEICKTSLETLYVEIVEFCNKNFVKSILLPKDFTLDWFDEKRFA